jgi:hypothetical protein
LYWPYCFLYLVPVDGSQAPILLSDNRGGGQESTSFGGAFTAAEDAIVFLEQFIENSPSCPCGWVRWQGLYRSTLEGDGTLVSVGRVSDYAHDRESAQVFFSSLNSGTFAGGVFVVPEDGSTTPLQLASGDGSTLAISPDRSRLVWGGFDGLFSAPLTGGVPTYLGPGASELTVTTNSRFVVYKDYPSLYSVAIDGSSMPERLHGPLSGSADVRSFQMAGSRVVFTISRPNTGRLELFLGVPGPQEGLRKSATSLMQPAGG